MAESDVLIIVAAKDEATRILKAIGVSAEQMGASVEKTGEAAKKTKPQMTSLEKDIRQLGTAMALVGTAKAAYSLGRLGAEAIRTSRAFQNISGGAGEAANRLNAMRDATRGAMTEQDLMSNANLLMQMGLANNSEELGRMTEMATKLGSAMGAGPNEAIGSFAMMLANQSIPRLDMFGISSGRVRERIAELQAQTKGMTREAAFMQAVMDEGGKAMERLGDSTNDPLLAFEQFEAQISNTRTEIAMKAAPTVAGFLGLMNRGMEEAGQWGMRLKQFGGGIAAAALNMVGAKDAALGLLNNWDLLDREGQQVVITTGDLGVAQAMATGALQTMGEAAGTAGEAQDGLATSIGTVAKSFGEMTFDNESLWNLAMASGASVDALAQLAINLGIATDGEIQASLKAYETVEAFGAGTLSADQYAAAMGRIGDAASEAAAKADRLAQLAPLGMGGGAKGYQHGTSFHSGGMAMVGEAGPEAVFLPRGTQVFPNQSSVTKSYSDNRVWTTTVNDQKAAALLIEQSRQTRLSRFNATM